MVEVLRVAAREVAAWAAPAPAVVCLAAVTIVRQRVEAARLAHWGSSSSCSHMRSRPANNTILGRSQTLGPVRRRGTLRKGQRRTFCCTAVAAELASCKQRETARTLCQPPDRSHGCKTCRPKPRMWDRTRRLRLVSAVPLSSMRHQCQSQLVAAGQHWAAAVRAATVACQSSLQSSRCTLPSCTFVSRAR